MANARDSYIRDKGLPNSRQLSISTALILSTVLLVSVASTLYPTVSFSEASTSRPETCATCDHRIWTDKDIYRRGEAVVIHIQPAVGGYGVGYALIILKPDGSNTTIGPHPQYGTENATYLIRSTDPVGLYEVELWGHVIYPGATPTLRAYCYFTVAQNSETTSLIQQPLQTQYTATQTCQPFYMLQTDNNDLYRLIGLKGEFDNNSRIIVTGLLNPYNASAYLHPTPNYKGTIYIQLLQSATTTQSYCCVTLVQISGSSTETVTLTKSFPAGLQVVTISGSLIYSNGVCARPVRQATDRSQMITLGNLEMACIVFVIFAFVFSLVLLRKRSWRLGQLV